MNRTFIFSFLKGVPVRASFFFNADEKVMLDGWSAGAAVVVSGSSAPVAITCTSAVLQETVPCQVPGLSVQLILQPQPSGVWFVDNETYYVLHGRLTEKGLSYVRVFSILTIKF